MAGRQEAGGGLQFEDEGCRFGTTLTMAALLDTPAAGCRRRCKTNKRIRAASPPKAFKKRNDAVSQVSACNRVLHSSAMS